MFKLANFHACTIRHMVGAILLTALLSACGYKGPLYLPPPPNIIEGQEDSTNGSLQPVPDVLEKSEESIPAQEFSLETTPILVE